MISHIIHVRNQMTNKNLVDTRLKKVMKGKKGGKPQRKPIQPGAEILERLAKMMFSINHGQQLFVVLLLREVRLLRESDLKLKHDINVLKDALAARSDQDPVLSSSGDAFTGHPDKDVSKSVTVFIAELVASLLGVDGAKNDGTSSDNEDGEHDDDIAVTK